MNIGDQVTVSGEVKKSKGDKVLVKFAGAKAWIPDTSISGTTATGIVSAIKGDKTQVNFVIASVWLPSKSVVAYETSAASTESDETPTTATESSDELPVLFELDKVDLEELIDGREGWIVNQIDGKSLIASHVTGTHLPQNIEIDIGQISEGTAEWYESYTSDALADKQKGCGFSDTNGPANVHPNSSGHVSAKEEIGGYQGDNGAGKPGQVGLEAYHFDQPTNEAQEFKGTMRYVST